MSEWVVSFDDMDSVRELENSFSTGPIVDDKGHHYITEAKVARIGSMQIDIFADEHPPPHFRVTFQGESANYRIDNGEQINGRLQRFRRNVSG